MDLEIINSNSDIIKYQNTDDVLKDVCYIIDSAEQYAHRSVNIALVQRNWFIGYRIAEEELKGKDRADYGVKVIKKLAKELTRIYGKGFTKTNLYNYLSFYKKFPEIFHAVSGKFGMLLSWTHYRILLQVFDKEARDWYEKEALEESWGTRTLQRNIDTQYYYRLLKSQAKEPVIKEMKENTKEFELETELETRIINNLQESMMELGKGYPFVARQQHIHTEKQEYYVDLVFYNYILKCFVLIDLKTNKITHQDVGQMDMYVRMYDELKKSKDDNPTIGILLCSETDEDIAKYSILKGNEHLFASKYKLYLPSEEELRAEIESQKSIYELQQKEDAG